MGKENNNSNLELFKLMQKGNTEAREQLILNNIKLVYKIVGIYFSDSGFEMEDLYGYGMIGLIKAVENYDISKNVKFSTYAARCISQEILNSIRFLKDLPVNFIKLEETAYEDGDITVEEIIADKKSEFTDYVINRVYLKKTLESISTLDRKLISMHFGLNGKVYSQRELSKMFNIPTSTVHAHIKRSLKKMRKNIERKK